MKKLFISAIILLSAQSLFGQMRLYAIRCNTNGSIDSIYIKAFTDSLFNSAGNFVQFSKEHFNGVFEPAYPNGFENYVQRADNIWININCFVNYSTVIPAVVVGELALKAGLNHTHPASDISNSTTAGRNFMTLSNPLEASVPAIQSNGTVNTRTSAQLKQDLSLDQVNNTSDANKPLSTAAIAALALKETIPVAGQGTGGSVTQTGNKGTAVTLNKICGTITTTNAALAAAAEVSFNLNNSTIALTDVVVVSLQGGAGVGTHQVWVSATAAGLATISIANLSTGSLSQALVINFMVIKSVNN